MLSYHQKYWTDIGLRLIDQNLNWILLHDSEFDLSGFNKVFAKYLKPNINATVLIINFRINITIAPFSH